MAKTKTKEGSVALLLSVLVSALYFTSYATRINFSAVMAEMISQEVLNKEQAGIIGSAMFFTYGFGQLVSGILGDRISAHRIICTGLVTTICCNFLMPFVEDPVLMAFVWGVNGVAQAFFWPPIVKLMTRHLNEAQYARCGIFISVGLNSATVLVYAIVPVFIKIFDWRSAFISSAIWAFIFFFIWIFGYREVERRRVHKEVDRHVGTDETPAAPQKEYKLGRLLIISGVCFIMGAITMQGYLRDGIQSWLPTFFTEVFSWSSSSAIFSNVIIPIFNLLVTLFATAMYRKVFKNEVVTALVFFIATFALCILFAVFFGSSPIMCLVIAALITGFIHGVNSMLTTFMSRRFAPYGKAATASGVTNACTYIGSTVASYGIAFTAENFGWKMTIISWAGIALVGAVLIVIGLPRFNRFIKDTEKITSEG